MAHALLLMMYVSGLGAALGCMTLSPLGRALDPVEFGRAAWFVQLVRDPVPLSCTYADQAQPTGRHQVLSVQHASSRLGGDTLCATVRDRSEPGRLALAPCWLPGALRELFGEEHWVVAVGADQQGRYSWAVITGQPSEEAEDGLCTSKASYYFGGLWILSREPVASPVSLAAARAAAVRRGISLQGGLHPVTHPGGCPYATACVKSEGSEACLKLDRRDGQGDIGCHGWCTIKIVLCAFAGVLVLVGVVVFLVLRYMFNKTAASQSAEHAANPQIFGTGLTPELEVHVHEDYYTPQTKFEETSGIGLTPTRTFD